MGETWKGATEYGILNVANLREHLLGAACWCEQLWRPERMDTATFLREWVPGDWIPFYEELWDSMPEPAPGWRLHDGGARTLLDLFLRREETGEPLPEYLGRFAGEDQEAYRQQVEEAAKRLEGLLGRLRAHSADSSLQTFFDVHLKAQARILQGLYAALAACWRDPPDFETARRALMSVLEGFEEGERGRWAEWYRGDLKVGARDLIARVEAGLSD